MSAYFAGWNERALELASAYATEGLDAAEFNELTRSVSALDLEEFQLAAAAVHIAALGQLEAPPADLMRKMELDALRFVASEARTASPAQAIRPRSAAQPESRRIHWLAAAGWATAAVLALTLVLRGSWDTPPRLSEQRTRLLSAASDLERVEWKPTEDPLGSKASGDVIWSPTRQEGYMSFRGLAPHDPQLNQYQLWIFDPTRGEWEAQPVDGGVFDVGADGETLVAIHPKLAVRKVALFAVTLEPPGGVVVSKREHLVLTAAL